MDAVFNPVVESNLWWINHKGSGTDGRIVIAFNFHSISILILTFQVQDFQGNSEWVASGMDKTVN